MGVSERKRLRFERLVSVDHDELEYLESPKMFRNQMGCNQFLQVCSDPCGFESFLQSGDSSREVKSHKPDSLRISSICVGFGCPFGSNGFE